MQKKSGTYCIVGLAFLVLVPAVSFAYYNPGSPQGFVSDFTNTLTQDEHQAFEAKLSAFEKETSSEISVVIIPGLEDDTIENFAVELFKEWGIGKQGKDNGVLLLVALNDRKVRIEVGYGLEGVLTDAQSSWIITNTIRPAFREEKYYEGLDAAVDQIIAATKGEYVSSETQSTESKNSIWDNFEFWLFLIFFVPMWLAAILSRSKSWWLGGVLGGVAGIIIGFIKGFLYAGFIWLILLVPIGLLFDFFVSRGYSKAKTLGHRAPWWVGGGFGGGFNPESLSKGLSATAFKNFAMASLGITAIMSAMIISTVTKGNVKAGIRLIPIFAVVAYLLFLGLSAALSVLFTGFT